MFLTYNPVAGCLVHAGNDPLAKATNDALNAARKQTSDERWKAGHSFDEPQGPTVLAREALEAIDGIVEVFSGRLTGVFYAETKDARGNVYPKMRLAFSENGSDPHVISLELAHEMTLQLIQRITSVQPGQWLIIRPTISPVERNGRMFANHNCIVKDDQDQLLSPIPGLWKQAQAGADEAAKKLMDMGIKEAKLINLTKAQSKLDFHRQLLDGIVQRFKMDAKPQSTSETAFF